jgi:hypothetical protein
MKGDLKLGWILFVVGFAGAALVGLLESINLIPSYNWVPWALIVVGAAIGLLNITTDEAVPVMIAALVLGMGAGFLAILPAIGAVLEAILMKIAFLSVPIAVPVAIKTIMDKCKS